MNHERFASLITRGKVVLARMAARALLQVTGLDGETFANVELLLPPGYVANPTGGDVVLLQTNGLRSHVVALGGDSTADTVADLQPGEIGLSRNGKTVLLRVGSVTIVDPAEIILIAPLVNFQGDVSITGNLHVTGNISGG
ncbi:phage baseplate assembly protein [Acidocella sp.]|uniref:phage baseplate assembly protein domain-containing protein n=1 Tax=Acidocella sp. TaxID=50710 RepID=UPI002608AB9C|nr:phage baseplate assembly protein [Acidocella sp.]MDD2794357.1 phage baseplate assembly protein [Acidocella sp.]